MSSQNALFIWFSSLKTLIHLDRRAGGRRTGSRRTGGRGRVHIEVLLRRLLVVVMMLLRALESNRGGSLDKVLGVDGLNGLVMVMSVVFLVLVTMLLRGRAAAAEKETTLFDPVVHGVGGNDHRQDGQGAECYDEFHSHQIIGLIQ